MSVFRNLITQLYDTGRLPKEYQEVNCVQFTSGAYIDTGIVPSNHTTEVTFDFESYYNDEHLFGTSTGYQYYHFTSYNNKYYWGENGAEGSGGNWTTGIHELIFNNDSTQIILDGNVLITTSSIGSSANLIMGKRDNTANFAGKIYKFKITDKTNDMVVRDFVPCYRKSDDVVGFYDLISKAFFYNNGSGSLIKGVEKITIPSAYQQLEYIEGTGTQYIDTGIYATHETNWELTFELTTSARNYQQYLAGGNTQICPKLYQPGSTNTTLVAEGSTNYNLYLTQYKKYTIKLDGNDLYLDNTLSGTYTRSEGTYQSPYWLFNSSAEPTLIAAIKIYELKVYTNNTLTNHFVPCYRKSDNAIGFYDKVGNSFYTNQGSGTFVKGGEIL